MKAWHDILRQVRDYGEPRADRTKVGTKALFGLQLEVQNTEFCFPAVTTKRLAVGQCFGELAAFIAGCDNLAQFHALGCTIWDANGSAPYWKPRSAGDLGRIYGVQWRDWNGHYDQLIALMVGLRDDPVGRRHILTTWNPSDLDKMCLPPCHLLMQAFVSGRYLDIQVYMRSVDLFLGLPFDIASYALLQQLMAKNLGLRSRRLIFSLGDAHIYNNHAEAVETVLSRRVLNAPKLVLTPTTTLLNFRPDQATVLNYEPWPTVKAEMAV